MIYILFPQANASPSDGQLSVNDKELSFTGTVKLQKKSESETNKKKIGVLPNFPNE